MPFLDEDGVTRLTEDYLDIFAPKEELGEGDGTNAGPIYELSAKGHAEQFSTSGKNLLKPATINTTSDGITWSNNSRGEIVANGTSNGNANIVFQITLPAGTYTASAPSSSQSSVFYASIGTGYLFSIVNQQTTTFTINSESVIDIRYIAASSSEPYVNYIFDCMIELGSEATEYEPYTGAAPSPSPDYPQEIRVVRGRNLAYFPTATSGIISENLNYSFDGNHVIISGTTTAQNSTTNLIVLEDPIHMAAGQLYTFSLSGKFSNTGTYKWMFYDVNGTVITGGNTENSKTNIQVFTPASDMDVYGLKFRAATSNATYDIDAYFQLTIGSVPQPYVPYGYVGMEAQGKNLANSTLEAIKRASAANIVWSGNTGTVNGIKFTINDDGSVTANGRSTNTAQVTLLINTQETGSYFYSGCPNGGTSGKYDLYPWDGSTNARPNSVSDNTQTADTDYGNGASCTFIKGHKNLIVIRIYADNTVSNLTFYPQVEAGTTRTSYQPYYHTTTPIPLPDRGWVGGLPDGTSDILTLDGAGKCEWELETEMCGISDFTWTLGSSNVFYLGESNLPNLRNGNTGITVYCESYKAITNVSDISAMISQVDDKIIASCKTTHKRIYVRDTDYSTAAEFNAAATNSKILYLLATSIIESKGYIEDWPTDIPEGATITIPELDALNVKYFVANDSISQYAEQWYERTKAVDIEPVEDAIGDLTSVVANLVTHDQFYFGYDEVNGKKMISIFKRGDI